MAPLNKWWILCAFSLSCLASLGACRRHRGVLLDGSPSELLIFNEICALKDDPGPCKAIKERYYFNVETGHCEMFEYGGCGGNDNNFDTMEACEETCIVTENKNPCHLPEAPGPCRGLVTRYFFDTKSQECKRFYYGGCFGNANNFRSMVQCQERCQNPVNQPVVHTHSARRSFVVEPTVVAVEMPANEHPVQLNETRQELTDTRPRDPCSEPVVRGDCDSLEQRFAFHPQSRRCFPFPYSGCGGNENNFRSRRECRMKCNRRRRAHGGKVIRIRKKNLDIIHRSD